jgi:hypothetical protein
MIRSFVFAIDPGPEQSSYVMAAPDLNIVAARSVENNELISAAFNSLSLKSFAGIPISIACESIESFGMPVGKEVFRTVHWCGRFHQRAEQLGIPFELVPRRVVKLYWCQTVRATDANIWQAMVDLWGSPGTKKAPGKLYGIHSHQRSALAIAGWKLDALVSQPTLVS